MRNAPETRPAKAPAGATNPTQSRRNVPDTNKFPSPGPVFFLIFACEEVEPYPTNLKSIIYKILPHGVTRAVKTCHREKPLN
jgi:hypothetical protein